MTFVWKNRKKNKAAHTFTESDKQIHGSPGCVWRREPHGPRVLPLHINIFIDPLKTQRHQKHHISGLQHTFTPRTHTHMHKQRHANIHTHARKKDKAPVVQTTMFTEGQIRASPRQQQQIESPPTALA